jgi:hypothetical protein
VVEVSELPLVRASPPPIEPVHPGGGGGGGGAGA